MKEIVIKSLERDRKKAVRVYGEERVLCCLSEKTEFGKLCEIYSDLQNDITDNKNLDEAKWLKGVIEKTIVSKVLCEQGYLSNGKRCID